MGDRSDTRRVRAQDAAAAPLAEDLEVVLEDAVDEAASPRRVCRDCLGPPDTEHSA